MDGLSFSLRLPKRDTSAVPQPLENVTIVGGGPAGFTAALYAGRAGLEPLVLVGMTLGGQMVMAESVENYPGFPEGIAGLALAQQMQDQAERYNARTVFAEVQAVDLSTRPFGIVTAKGPFQSRTLIVATGSTPRYLGVPGEERFIGHGVSYCAACDGYLYRDREVVVVGGGDSAMDEALFLSRLARQVTVVHRRDQLRASAPLRERAMAVPNVRFEWNTIVEEILGSDYVVGVRLRDVKTDERRVLPTDGVFIYVGVIPNTQLFHGQLELDVDGYIVTDKRQHTSVPGVFAAGDVQDPLFRQAVVAAGTGAAAAIEAERFLVEMYPRPA